jgi:hypothetical protein
MDELRILVALVVGIVKLVYYIVRGVYRSLRAIVLWVAGKVRGTHLDGPGGAIRPPRRMTAAAAPSRPAPPTIDRAAANRLAAELQKLATQARALAARCKAARLCARLRPTLGDFVLPELDKALDAARRAPSNQALARVASTAAFLEALTEFLTVMADQRSDPSYEELIDDADALADACYRPVVDYCRTNDVPLSSDRTATVFGDGCSPWLGRIDDPTGLAVLHLPWKWLAEVHRWPAIGHEVGHDFYESVAGLDRELLGRMGLGDAARSARIIEGRYGVTMGDVHRLVVRWRQELTADAFGVMMLGPAYAVTTAAIFASPGDPAQALLVQMEGDQYEVHPPGHIRVAAVCRLLVSMGYGALAEGMEQRWRAQHGDPQAIVLPTTSGYLRVDDEPFIESAAALTTALQREGFAALKGIPLSSMPGFDFGPREHEASLRIRDAFVAGGGPRPDDARLLIAGAVLAWAERPGDGVRLLRDARLAVGSLDLPIAADARAAEPRAAEWRRELIRDAVLLDVLLTPPRASLLPRR